MKHGRMTFVALFLSSTIGPAMAGVPTTTSTTVVTTTSTTLPTCSDEATFESAHCRLGELSDAIAAEPGLGSIATKLSNAVDFADRNVGLASEQCSEPDLKSTRGRLRRAIRRLIQYGHRLRSLKSRNTIPEEIRTPFIDAGRAIQQDLEALRNGLVCPPASPSGAFL
jgi:hypothetical protein